MRTLPHYCAWRTEQLSMPVVMNDATDMKIGPCVSFSLRIMNCSNSYLKTGMLLTQVAGDFKTRLILPSSELPESIHLFQVN